MSRFSKKYSQNKDINLLVSLLKAYSPSGDTTEALNIIASFLEEIGLRPSIDSYDTLTCNIGSKPKVLICGHVDTVPGELPVVVDGDTVSGRGAVDAKGPLAAAISALARLVKRNIDGILFAVVSDEEKEGGKGTRLLIKQLPNTLKWSIVTEPTRGRGVAISYYGRLTFKLAVKGRPMHASASIKFENTIETCFKTYMMIKESIMSLLGKTPICPIMVRGGGHHGLMPEQCNMYVDIRVPPGYTLEQVIEKIEKVINSLNNSRLEYEVEWCSSEEPYSIEPENPLVTIFTNKIREVMRVDPLLIKKLGTSDFNLIGRELGIPIIAYGPGNPRLSHTNIERVSISEYLASIKVLESALGVLCNG